MNYKDLTDSNDDADSSNDSYLSEKPLNPEKISSGRVDINVLRSKLEAQQSKELRKNIIIFSFCVLLLSSIGIFLSL
tara:strand:+ start:99 stop:329 length:231 start_codon:yes stop_codon:yes gene_type:complete